MSNLSLWVEDQSLMQSISYPLYQLLPDAILQKLLRVHLKHHIITNTCIQAATKCKGKVNIEK